MSELYVTTREEGSGPKDGTKYTRMGAPEGKKSLTWGGRSWTRNWQEFDNSYFSQMKHTDNDPCTNWWQRF